LPQGGRRSDLPDPAIASLDDLTRVQTMLCAIIPTIHE